MSITKRLSSWGTSLLLIFLQTLLKSLGSCKLCRGKARRLSSEANLGMSGFSWEAIGERGIGRESLHFQTWNDDGTPETLKTTEKCFKGDEAEEVQCLHTSWVGTAAGHMLKFNLMS